MVEFYQARWNDTTQFAMQNQPQFVAQNQVNSSFKIRLKESLIQGQNMPVNLM